MPSAVDVHPLEDAAVAEGVPDERANQWHSEGAHQANPGVVAETLLALSVHDTL
jgi:hypothetical protein